ncbi:hypothetical protein VQ03_05240 [Methylobacterium tarhaniae]|uniref:Uncharacterized protein n=1 Tax=Methylobacterium tarhaniae TaxID=1187852 RepID=A0A0J6VXM7_9HYPH|nr:DUF6616 family protein [Methylobacterium tarhaniae]KMO44056.1 hypothetical protein VQ03_05240 [Methylobacterium tarhaniae]
MTHMLVELYEPKPAWLSLDAGAREAFFAKVGDGMAALTALGIEPVGFGDADPAVPHGTGRRFFAVWRLPDRHALGALVEGIAASGWQDFFDTINAAGQVTGIADHLTQLARL